MTIEEMRTRKIELGFTNEMLSRASGVPLSTVQKIMGGLTKAPRKLTVDALRKVLEAADTGQDNMSGQRRYSYTSQPYDSDLKPAACMMCEPAMIRRLRRSGSIPWMITMPFRMTSELS